MQFQGGRAGGSTAGQGRVAATSGHPMRCVKSPLDRHLHLKLGAQRQACTQVENIERDESRPTSTQNEETYPDIFGRVDFCPPKAHISKNKDNGHQQTA